MPKPEQRRKKGIAASIRDLFRARDCLNLRNVRLKHLKYMLIFPLAPVFANMQKALFSDSLYFFGLDAMTLTGSAYCFGAGMFFALARPRAIAKNARILAAATAVFFVSWVIMPESRTSVLTAMFFAAGLGGCAAYASFAYTFILNNTERFLGASGISLFFALNQLDYGLNLISGIFARSYLTVLVAGTCICLMLYKKDDFSDVEEKPRPALNPPLLLALYFFVAHYFVEIFYTYLPGSSARHTIILNGAVGILVVFLGIALQFATRRSIWNMCNLFFIAIIATYVLCFMPEGSAFRSAARFLHGFEQMGYIAAYYLLGCVFKKHGDFGIFRLCLITILPVSMLSYLIPGVIAAYAPSRLPLAGTLVSSLVFIVFILMSPAYFKYLFFADWSDDFHGIDMNAAGDAARDEKHSAELEHCGLSPREKEVALLLLQGKNAKHIAEKLEISTNTVNFHIKNLYKKVGISARSELFARFGSKDPEFENGEKRAGPGRKVN